MASQTAAPSAETHLEVRRRFPAPRERVFRAWTEPAALRAWYCPVELTVGAVEVDLRVGGRYRVEMQPPADGGPYVARGVYREIVPPERLVFTWAWEGSAMGETLVTVTFIAHGAETEVVLRHELFPDAAARDAHARGWAACLAHLARALPQLP